MNSYGTARQFSAASASYDNQSPPDADETLDYLQDALFQIPAFVLEAEDNAPWSQRQKLHLYASCGDKAAYLSLAKTISDEYAELRFTQTLNDYHGNPHDAADHLLRMWQEEQSDMAKEGA